MTDVAIKRLSLRIIRHGGWSWGPHPQSWVDLARNKLGALIAERLIENLPDGTEVSKTISLTLRSGSDRSGRRNVDEFLHAKLHLERQIDEQLAEIVPALVAEQASKRRMPIDPSGDPEGPREALGVKPNRLIDVVLEWLESGRLERVLAMIDLPGLAFIMRDVMAELPPVAETGSTEHSENLEAELKRSFVGAKPSGGPAAMLRSGILGLSQLLVGDPSAISRQRIQMLMAAHLPIILSPASSDADAESGIKSHGTVSDQPAGAIDWSNRQSEGFQERPETGSSTANSRSKSRQQVRDIDVQVDSILPYLVAGALNDLGYWRVLGGLLDAANETEQAELFALGLANKLMSPAERGWHRSPNNRLVANTFAARPHDRDENGLIAFAKRANSYLSALDAVLQDSLNTGHDPASPLVLYEFDDREDGLILFDSDGLFPVCWLNETRDLLPRLRELRWPTVFVSTRSPRSSGLEPLLLSTSSIVTDILPDRARDWTRVRDANGSLLWVDSRFDIDGCARNRISRFSDYFDRVALIVDELLVQRTATATELVAVFERSIGLACCVGLGSIAWTLWGREGGADPALAMERFCDLGGVVRFETDRIRVKVPLGKRCFDLRDAGLLQPIRSLPWCGGRFVDFEHG